MNFSKILLITGLLMFEISALAAERLYTCNILTGPHKDYNVNVIKSSSGALKINLLASMNTLVTYTIKSENLCYDKGYCVSAESSKRIESKTMKMGLSISNKPMEYKGKTGFKSKASFDAFDLRNEPGRVRTHDENVDLVCYKIN